MEKEENSFIKSIESKQTDVLEKLWLNKSYENNQK